VPYKVSISKRAAKQFAKLTSQVQEDIRGVVNGLKIDPRPVGAIKLKGIDAYRVKCGDYRIIYDIEDCNLIILVLAVGDRKDIYKQAV
jgi:mRNA interferase RelE/StbE